MMFARFFSLCFLAAAVAFGQADTGRPGTVFFVEGAVSLENAPVTIDPARPTEMRKGQRLRTEQGNAEMLFALGSFMRLGADSDIEMVDSGLTSATVRLHRGAVIVEAFRVTTAGQDYKVKKKQSAALGPDGVQITKIKAFTADALTSWHEQRAKTVLAETPKSERRKGGSSASGDGESLFGLGDLPNRSQAGIGP